MRPDDGRVVPNFIAAALAGRDMEIAGTGAASRCFQYVADCVQGLCAVMNGDVVTPVNVGCEVETEIKELAGVVAEVVARKTGRGRVGVVLVEKREDDPFRRRPDVSLARERLGWMAKVGLTEGLEATVDWFLTLPEFS